MTEISLLGKPNLLRLTFLLLCFFVAITGFGGEVSAQTLYNGTLGTVPGSQGWGYLAVGSASQTLTNNAVQLDTSASQNTQAGYSRTDNVLNHTNGYTVTFTSQMLAEIHANTNRAGFSVIVLSSDKHGIELAFWTNLIFAQTDSPLFTQGESVSINTTGSFIHYALTMLATNYVLRANGSVILTGRIHDYTAFTGFPNVYSTPNFIFFGDDTTSASASVQIQDITLIQPPTLTMPQPNVLAWTGVSNQTYTVQTSSNLVSWITAGSATSATVNYSFTNSASAGPRYFRIAYP